MMIRELYLRNTTQWTESGFVARHQVQLEGIRFWWMESDLIGMNQVVFKQKMWWWCDVNMTEWVCYIHGLCLDVFWCL